MAGFTMAEASNILKIDYLPVVREQIPVRTPLFDRLRKGTEDVVGSNARIALHTARNQGIGSRSDTNPTLPAAGQQKYRTIDIPTTNIYARMMIQGKVFRAAKTDRGAFINAVDAEMKGMTEAFQWELNRQLYSKKTGALGVIATAAAANATQTVTASDASYLTRWLTPGMVVDIVSTGGVLNNAANENRTISTVNKTTGAILFDAAVTPANGDIIVRADSWNNEITGLMDVFTNDNVIYGLDRNALDQSGKFFNTLNFASSGTLTEMEIQQVLDEVEVNTNGGNISLMISDHASRRIFQKILVSLKRFTEPTKLKGGWTALDYNGIPWVVDPDANKQRLYFLDESTWKIHTMIGELFTWGEEDNQVLRAVAGSDSYEAFMVSYMELVCDTPAKNAVLTNVVA